MGRNIMVFGLTEAKDEDISEAVCSIFESVNEKRKFEAVRLGKPRSDSANQRNHVESIDCAANSVEVKKSF